MKTHTNKIISVGSCRDCCSLCSICTPRNNNHLQITSHKLFSCVARSELLNVAGFYVAFVHCKPSNASIWHILTILCEAWLPHINYFLEKNGFSGIIQKTENKSHNTGDTLGYGVSTNPRVTWGGNR